MRWWTTFFDHREKHDFDLSTVIQSGTDTWKRGKDGELHEIIIDGYQCKKCKRILYLNYDQITDLPKAMSYCEVDKESKQG